MNLFRYLENGLIGGECCYIYVFNLHYSINGYRLYARGEVNRHGGM